MHKNDREIQENNYFKFRNAEKSTYSIPKYLFKILPNDKNSKILDIGCGLGSFMLEVKKLGYSQVDGIDISQEAVENGKKNKLNIIKINDICNFVPNVKYDFFIMNHVLEHVEKKDIIITLKHIRENILNRNGHGIIVVPNAQSNTDSYWAYEDFTHSTLFTTGSLYYVLKSAGFDSISFLDKDGLDGTRGFVKLFKRVFIFFYKLNKHFWNRVTSSSYHKKSPIIFTFEIKAFV